MFIPRFIIIRKIHQNKKNENDENKESKRFYSEDEYIKYIEKYGHHFNEKSSNYASKILKSDKKLWSSEQVKKVMKNLGFSIKEEEIYDATYLSNYVYSMFSPTPLKDEISCFELVYKILNDFNGYDGKVFDEWVYSMMKRNIRVNWKEIYE